MRLTGTCWRCDASYITRRTKLYAIAKTVSSLSTPYTTLAHGAQGIGDYVWWWPHHEGRIVDSQRFRGQGHRGMLTGREEVMKHVKVIIEKHPDGYVAYPVGVKGVVVGEGDSYEDALRDVQSALKFHLETFVADGLDGDEPPVLEALVAEASV